MAQNQMSQVPTFWIITSKAHRMRDTHGNAASPSPWQLGRLQGEGMELCGGLMGHHSCTGRALWPFLLLWQQVQVEPGVICMVAVVLFYYLMELRMDPTTCIRFSSFLLKEAKCENLVSQFFSLTFIVVSGRAFGKVLQESRSQFPWHYVW